MLLNITNKQIDLAKSEILFDQPFNENTFDTSWSIKHGEWWVKDGWLIGKNPEFSLGSIVSAGSFPGDILMEFDAGTVLPCTHDIDFFWRCKWNEEKNTVETAYIAGVEGWWEGKVGVEKAPEYNFFAMTPCFDFEAGKVYNIKAGDIGGHIFIFVDNNLILEAVDPSPIKSEESAKIGFEAIQSYLKITNLKVYKIDATIRRLSYGLEF